MKMDQNKPVGELNPEELYLYILTLLTKNGKVDGDQAEALMTKIQNKDELGYEDRIFLNESIDQLKEYLFVDEDTLTEVAEEKQDSGTPEETEGTGEQEEAPSEEASEETGPSVSEGDNRV